MNDFIDTVSRFQEATRKLFKSQLEKGAISRKEYERLIAKYPFLKDPPKKKAWSKKETPSCFSSRSHDIRRHDSLWCAQLSSTLSYTCLGYELPQTRSIFLLYPTVYEKR